MNNLKLKKNMRKIYLLFNAIKTWFFTVHGNFQRLILLLIKKNKQFEIELLLIERKKYYVENYGNKEGLKKYKILCSKLTDGYFLNKKIIEKFN